MSHPGHLVILGISYCKSLLLTFITGNCKYFILQVTCYLLLIQVTASISYCKSLLLTFNTGDFKYFLLQVTVTFPCLQVMPGHPLLFLQGQDGVNKKQTGAALQAVPDSSCHSAPPPLAASILSSRHAGR